MILRVDTYVRYITRLRIFMQTYTFMNAIERAESRRTNNQRYAYNKIRKKIKSFRDFTILSRLMTY